MASRYREDRPVPAACSHRFRGRMKGRGRSCSIASLCTGRCSCEGDVFFLVRERGREYTSRSGEGTVTQLSFFLPATFDLVHLPHLFSSNSRIKSAAQILDSLQSLGIKPRVRKRCSLRTDPGDENTNKSTPLSILSTLDTFESFCCESLGQIICPCSSISIPWAAHVPANVFEEAVR